MTFEDSLLVMADEEPFALYGLASYQLLDELVELLLVSDESHGVESTLDSFMKTKRAQGQLPMGAFGVLEFERHVEQAQALVEPLKVLCRDQAEDTEVNMQRFIFGSDKPVHLQGWINQHYQAGLIRYRVGRIRGQDYLAAWIDHLIMAVMGASCPTHLIGYDRKAGVKHLIFDEIDNVTQATDWLDELLCLYMDGMNEPLPYFPGTALAGLEAGINRQGEWVEDVDKSIKKMAEVFAGNSFMQIPGEGSNPYIVRIWPEWSESLAQQLRQCGLNILHRPRFRARESESLQK
ncbi:hypothetical protein P4S72_01290 [Vibrio sp. PP-XX7]